MAAPPEGSKGVKGELDTRDGSDSPVMVEKGKVPPTNTVEALAPLIYVSSVINTPVKAIKEINNIIQNFMWDCSTSKIAQKTLIQSISKGGLKLCHFETKVKALKLSWVKN